MHQIDMSLALHETFSMLRTQSVPLVIPFIRASYVWVTQHHKHSQDWVVSIVYCGH